MSAPEIAPCTQKTAALLHKQGGLCARLGGNIKAWTAAGYTHPGRCFVFLQGGTAVGGMALGSFAPATLDVMDFALEPTLYRHAPWLIGGCLAAARGPEHRQAAYNLYNDGPLYASTLAAFHAAGFATVQHKQSYAYSGPAPEEAPRLRYVSLREAGQDAFVQAIELVTRGTLDSFMARQAHRQGETAFAQSYYAELQRLDPEPGRWLLGYEGDALAGLVVAQVLGKGTGAINYVGVAPALRGRGLGEALLRRGTALLCAAGTASIIADIDTGNHPMRRALEAIGYRFCYDETVLEKGLSPS